MSSTPTDTVRKYEVVSTIGKGSFGVIRKVRRDDGLILCRKEISYIKMSPKEREQLHQEFSILSTLQHPNIVSYYHREHLKTTQDLYLYMEYCGGGDLSKEIERLKKGGLHADEGYVWGIFSQIVSALYRCHYGVMPPDGGGLVTKADKGRGAMILHRDLKPENVFLGADNSVKLGDFGLSKLMQSHDFASTYVGTPFYMSPEICAAERYTLHSDIWSLGCVMYELCARTQPFNARTHFHLIQKIKEGKLEPLPSFYSQELQRTIKECLNVNPLKRPDTVALLNVPSIRMVRQEREMVELGRILKDKEAHAELKAREADAKATRMQNEREQIRAELEATLRREWEVKAGLEITRQVQLEKDRLNKIFESEVALRVKTEVARQLRSRRTSEESQVSEQSSPRMEPHFSSVSTAAETDFPSTTDLSSLSLDSPTLEAPPQITNIKEEVQSKTPPPQRRSRGPLARARTQFDSPMDVAMVDPSPMCIASLSLSPRRADTTGIPSGRNIFANADKARLPQPTSPKTSSAIDEDDETVPDLPSPTRRPSVKQALRPGMLRQKTAPMNRAGAPRSTIFAPTAAEHPVKVPSPQGKRATGFSPVRKPPPKPTATNSSEDMFKAVLHRQMQNATGRTLVELAQARAGMPSQAQKIEKGLSGFGTEEKKENMVIWDPEKDEMPSPFLKRGAGAHRRLY